MHPGTWHQQHGCGNRRVYPARHAQLFRGCEFNQQHRDRASQQHQCHSCSNVGYRRRDIVARNSDRSGRTAAAVRAVLTCHDRRGEHSRSLCWFPHPCFLIAGMPATPSCKAKTVGQLRIYSGDCTIGGKSLTDRQILLSANTRITESWQDRVRPDGRPVAGHLLAYWQSDPSVARDAQVLDLR